MPAAKKAATKTPKATKATPAPAPEAPKKRGRPPGSKKAVPPQQTSFPEQQMSQDIPNVPVTSAGKPPPWEIPTGQPHHTAHNQTAPLAPNGFAPPPVGAGLPAGVAAVNDPAWLVKLHQWDLLKQRIAEEIKPLLDQEMEMRRSLAQAFFPVSDEGTNTCDLAEGWKLKYINTFDRAYDEATWAPVFAQLGGNDPQQTAAWQQHLIVWKPQLNLKNYRTLDDNVRLIVDQCVITKPSAPTLQLVPPKAKDE